MEMLRNFRRKHQELKEKIHSTRIPLSKRGQIMMGFVYCSIPLIIGKFAYDYTSQYSENKWKSEGKNGFDIGYLPPQMEKERAKIETHAKGVKGALENMFKEVNEKIEKDKR